jgi:hypothetical protein
MAPNPKIIAVRAVLYEPKRLKKLLTHTSSIAVLMNLDPDQQIPFGDLRVHPGAGPNWFIPLSGQISPAVLEAANRCDRIADLLLETRRALARVAFNGTDKAHLRAALAEQAEAWKARGKIWRAPGPNADAAGAAIATHAQASLREYKRVKKYLKNIDPGRIG